MVFRGALAPDLTGRWFSDGRCRVESARVVAACERSEGNAIVTAEHCETQLARLGVLRGVVADVSEYVKALSDVPELVFTEAVSHAIKTRPWFPTPAELRVDCDVAAQSFRTAAATIQAPQIEDLAGGGRVIEIPVPAIFGDVPPLRLKITRVWKFDCEDCGDSGWRSRQCPEMVCGRRFDHAAHEWVHPCECRSWNPTLRRRAEANAKYSEAPQRAGH